MKILRIRVEGLPLYQQEVDISFLAAQRVQANHQGAVSKLFGNIYVNNAEAFIGINASGKTTALNVIVFSCMLLNAMPLNNDPVPKVIGSGGTAVFDIDFYADAKLYHLHSKIAKTQEQDGVFRVKILSETLQEKSANSKITKANVFSWGEITPTRERNNAGEYLPDDVSIAIALIKQLRRGISMADHMGLTNHNMFLPIGEMVPPEIISILDPSIEYISIEKRENKIRVKLKFYHEEELELHNAGELDYYLSSGTIKGIRVFDDAVKMLAIGGYFIIDEIENHFNQELVATLLRLFLDKRTNPHGAVIVFSTHYPELLDELERNDAVFITKHEPDGLKIDNLSTLLKRNDMKKSDVYQSNLLGGTAPKYEALLALQKSVRAGVV